jgi:hypothetical protein
VLLAYLGFTMSNPQPSIREAAETKASTPVEIWRYEMSKRDELITKYAADLKEKCGVPVDLELLTEVTKGCGPAIYDSDASIVSASDKEEMERIKKNFLVKKLGLTPDAALDAGIEAVVDQYGRSNRHKYRAVFYYLLVKHFGREKMYS